MRPNRQQSTWLDRLAATRRDGKCPRRLLQGVLSLKFGAARMQDRLGVAVGLGAALEDEVAGGLEGDRGRRNPAPSDDSADRRRSAGRRRAAMRCSVSITCSSETMPWRSQLAMCWLEMRSVARSSIRPTSLMSGTFEQPMPWSIQRTT